MSDFLDKLKQRHAVEGELQFAGSYRPFSGDEVDDIIDRIAKLEEEVMEQLLKARIAELERVEEELMMERENERMMKESAIKSLEPYIARLEAVADAAAREHMWVCRAGGQTPLADALTALEEWRKEEA